MANWNDQGNPEPCTLRGQVRANVQAEADRFAEELVKGIEVDAYGHLMGLSRRRWESDRKFKERILAAMTPPGVCTVASLKAIPGVRHVQEDRELHTVTIRVGWWRWLWPRSVRRLKRHLVDVMPVVVVWRVKPCWR